jgi:hypothetical protein
MQKLTKQGKWSDWISNEGNTDPHRPLGYTGSLDVDCEVKFNIDPFNSFVEKITWWRWQNEGNTTFSPFSGKRFISEYRYRIPEEDETKPETTQTQDSEKKHSHYFKDVSKLNYIDVYRVIDLFKIQHPCLQHAVKKLLVSGGRGHKDEDRDIQDVIDSCVRWQEMRKEDSEK